jgi:hypothetical protein
MPAVMREETKYSLLQKFRRHSERALVEVAQEELYRKYPGTALAAPVKRSPAVRLVRWGFKTGFRLFPRPLRDRVMRIVLVRKGQGWDPA